ncbi:MAG TPA: ABC transporter permease subunit [Ideonella sp.]|uniref:ABC transporter permease n=1 Tax=Ideonella sp. TaxID=1929293 RepID=UPI002E34B31D|nr:ABC transporter permease subunit [Ideonella sp.]HEX5688253.1 ABC transporter permease subunit [Ideonella sp.]
MSRAVFGTRFAAGFGKAWLVGGFLFLYLPMITLIIYSFNKSPLPAVWGGFTFEWYGKLIHDTEILSGLWMSLKIAFLSACFSVIFGTLAAFALVKYRRFTGRTLFSGMVSAPLVMPEVIQGLSLLLMLVAIQGWTQSLFGTAFPEKGLITILLGHMMMGLAYAAVVISARLQDLNPQLEEAAMDLGAKPWQVFYLVTLPMISQSLVSAWLLTFSLSLDDVVVSAFLNGPGSTTMPLVIFSRARLGLSPSINAVATLIIVAVAVCVTVASIMVARAERRRAAEISAAQRDAS